MFIFCRFVHISLGFVGTSGVRRLGGGVITREARSEVICLKMRKW